MLRIWDRILDVLAMVVAVLVAGIVTILGAQIILRFVFNAPITWSDECAEFQFVWLIFLGAPVVARNHGHLTAEVVAGLLPFKWEVAREIVLKAMTIAFFAVIFWESVPLVSLFLWVPSPVMRMPMGVLFGSVLVASLLTALEYARQVGVDCLRLWRGEPPAVATGGDGVGGL